MTEADFERGLLSYWDQKSGSVGWKPIILGIAATVVSIAFAIHIAFYVTDWIARSFSYFLVFCSGTIAANAVGRWKIRSIRRQQAARAWVGYSAIPSRLDLYETETGLRAIGTGYRYDLQWISITDMILSDARPRVWLAFANNLSLVWISEQSFDDICSFEEFTEHAWRAWKSSKPSGKAFEVLSLDHFEKHSS